MVTSKDGTKIAYDWLGDGPAVILVGGAFIHRGFPKPGQLAKLMSGEFTFINYDRRGRGESGQGSSTYDVEREIEDLAAVIAAAGGSASLVGWSSGAVLVMRAVATGLPVERLVLFEPPLLVDDSRVAPPADFLARLERRLADGRRGDTVKLYMTEGMGVPGAFVTMMRLTPNWKKLTAVAHTLPYDWQIVRDLLSGTPPHASDWAAVSAPGLVLSGSKSPIQLRNAARALADVLPDAEHLELKGQSHNPSMKAHAPVLKAFLHRGAHHA